MIKPIFATIGLLAVLLTACGSAADSPPEAAAPATVPARPIPVLEAVQFRSAVCKDFAPSPAAVATSAAPIPEPGFDDDRVEGLVAEWEADLAAINRVADCVERELGLRRPLLPEDFALQANQPAIVSCVKREVGNE